VNHNVLKHVWYAVLLQYVHHAKKVIQLNQIINVKRIYVKKVVHYAILSNIAYNVLKTFIRVNKI